MQKALFLKAAITALLAAALLIPLGMIDQLVGERQQRQVSVSREIAESFAGSQRIAGPLLVLPYQEHYRVLEWVDVPDGEGDTKRMRRPADRSRSGRLVLLPEQTEMRLAGTTDFKHRGLFKTLVYALDGTIDGSFSMPSTAALEGRIERATPDSRIDWQRPWLSLGLTDTRGLSRAPLLVWDGADLAFAQGSRLGPAVAHGIHAPLPMLDGMAADHGQGAATSAGPRPDAARSVPFEIALGLRGTELMRFVPLADTTRVRLDSDWPHPSFVGRFLPDAADQRIDADGFSAAWEVTSLATTAPSALLKAIDDGDACQAGCAEWFGVRLVEPVNVYSMADRALKYSVLFVLLSFGAFFLFELLKGLRIHPAQYLLVGLALALFFLLLLSLSEHLPFGQAYAAAALACVGLQGWYLSSVLGSPWRGLGFAALLGALFATLFGLLRSEDSALLLGSLLLFGLLALTMALTRRLDWYAIGAKAEDRKDP